MMPLASVPQKGMLDDEGSITNPGDWNVSIKESRMGKNDPRGVKWV